MRNVTKIICALLVLGALFYLISSNSTPTNEEVIIKVKANKSTTTDITAFIVDRDYT